MYQPLSPKRVYAKTTIRFWVAAILVILLALITDVMPLTASFDAATNAQPVINCNTPPSPASPNIEIVDIQVTQGVSATQSFISGRSTAVLVYVCARTNITLSGHLFAIENGQVLSDLSAINQVSLNASAQNPQSAFLVFEPLIIERVGTIDLQVQLFEPTTPNIPIITRTRNNVPFLIDPVQPQFYFSRIVLDTNPYGFPSLFRIRATRGDAFARAVIPLNDFDEWNYAEAPNSRIVVTNTIDLNENGIIDGTDSGKLLCRLSLQRTMIANPFTYPNGTVISLGPTELTFLYGWIHDPNGVGIIELNGDSIQRGRVGFGSTSTNIGQLTYVHEMLHNLGGDHDDILINFAGWDVNQHLPRGWLINNLNQYKDANLGIIMNVAPLVETSNRWMSPSDYDFYLNYFNSTRLQSFARSYPRGCDGMSDPCLLQDNVLISGEMSDDGTSVINTCPIFQMSWYSQPTESNSSRPSDLPFTLVFRDDEGRIIEEIPFDARNETSPTDSDGVNYGAFEVLVPGDIVERTEQITIRNSEGSELPYQTRADSSLDIDMLQPGSDSDNTVNDQLVFEVNVSGSNSRDLECNFTYSPDDGNTWMPLAVAVPCTSGENPPLPLEVQGVPPSDGLGVIRAHVTDGLNIDNEESSGLTVEPQLVGYFEQTASGGTQSIVRDGLAFQVHAHDAAIGENDGDGISFVNMIILDASGRVVYENVENFAGYCGFGGGQPDCTIWFFEANNYRWPETNGQLGESIRSGKYTLRSIINADSGERKLVETFIEIRLENTPTPIDDSWEGYKTLTGDINGDGRTDLVWNRTAHHNHIVAGLSNGDGTFQFTGIQETQNTVWNKFKTFSGDVNADGYTDLIWNETTDKNRVYVGFSNGNGTFTVVRHQDISGSAWHTYKTLTGDVNGDGRIDLVWSETQGAFNRTYIGLSNGNGTFSVGAVQRHPRQGWDTYDTLIGDVNGDGRDDLIWNRTGNDRNRMYVGLSAGNGELRFLSPQDHINGGWADYQKLVGDINGDGLDDLIWNRTHAPKNRIYVGLANSNGSFTLLAYNDRFDTNWTGYIPATGDIDGDGRTDLVWNRLSERNRTYVGFSNTSINFNLSPQWQRTERIWGDFKMLTGDVDGDGRTDLIWNETTEKNRTYVALSTASGQFNFRPFQDYP
ncbi:MAG: VCBS repeat-containing protein [Chloroflexota bacterium]